MLSDRILVTGTTGFLGRQIASAFTSLGKSVHGVTANGRAGPPGVTMHRIDLTQPDAVDSLIWRVRPTHLVHAAWDVTHGAYWTSETNYVWLEQGRALLQAFRTAGGLRAVGIGTCAEYNWNNRGVYREAGPVEHPQTLYGRCKLELCESYVSNNFGPSSAWARVFFPYGPNDNVQRFLPSLISCLMREEPFNATSCEQLRDFVFVSDLAAATAALTLSNVTGIVNVGSGQGVSLKEVALRVAKALNVSPSLLRFGAIPDRAGDPAVLIADNTRLRDEVGFRNHTPLSEGIARTIAWVREHSSDVAFIHAND